MCVCTFMEGAIRNTCKEWVHPRSSNPSMCPQEDPKGKGRQLLPTHTYPPHTHTLHTHIPSTYTYAPHTQTHHTHTLHTHTTHIPSTHTHTLHSVGTCQGAPVPPDGCCLCRAVLPGVDVRRELRDRALQPGGPRLQETAPVQLPRGQCPHLHQVGHSAESITPGARHLDPSPVSDSCGFEQLPQS